MNWQKLREARRREGSYLLRPNVTGGDPAQLWAFYLQLVEVEQAFNELKSDLAIRRLRSLEPGLTPRTVILTRYTEPEADQAILPQRLQLSMPTQSPPEVIADDVPQSE